MPLSDDAYNRHSTYFGVFSAAQATRVSELLEGLGVRYEFIFDKQSEERLSSWGAYDPTASDRHVGHELFIHDDDVGVVGSKIVDMYPGSGSDVV
jgi:hypothetical protein